MALAAENNELVGSTAVQELQAVLARHETALRSSRPELPVAVADDVLDKIAMLQLVREIDFRSAALLAGQEGWEGGDLGEFGFPYALSLLYRRHRRGRCPLVPTTPALASWARDFSRRCGHHSQVALLFGLARTGEMSLERHGTTFVFRPRHADAGVESSEWDNHSWRVGFTRAMDQDLALELARTEPLIRAELRRNVFEWGPHFLGYDSTPLLDEYFLRRGILEARTRLHQDAFDGEATFGGLPFNGYRASVGILVGFALKHLGFCHEFASSRRGRYMGDLVTITAEKKQLTRALADALGTTMNDSRRYFAAASLSPSLSAVHLRAPMSAPPPVIDVGSGQVIRSITGTLHQPFHFMLTQLKQLFPSDWDRAVNAREKLFRDELHRILGRAGHVRVATNGFKIRSRGRTATDVDAAILDLRTGVVALFQLKWWDAFAADPRRRASAKKNLAEATAQWIQRVRLWLSESGESGICNVFGVPSRDVSVRLRPRLFVLGRNYVHFAGMPRDPAVAYGTWLQVLRLIMQEGEVGRADLTGFLHDRLRREQRAPRPIQEADFDFGEIHIRLERQ